ncbi:MAG: hypothetical protein K6T85_05885 [Gorillibacterium sp.]|nr:hypothetical protein [Gorillibacterium sp.]
MSQLEIEELVSCTETGRELPENLLATIASYFSGKSNIYAYMDHAVALGTYDDGRIQIGLGQEERIVQLTLFDNVQELRVFNKEQEFRAVNIAGEFRWRLRVDGQGTQTIHILDETHKLWGAVKESKGQEKWSLLRSDRGSAIYYPGTVYKNGEKGLIVRNYIQFNGVSLLKEGIGLGDAGLTHFVDERLCEFVDWPAIERGEQDYGRS